jgi:hypothetical protein
MDVAEPQRSQIPSVHYHLCRQLPEPETDTSPVTDTEAKEEMLTQVSSAKWIPNSCRPPDYQWVDWMFTFSCGRRLKLTIRPWPEHIGWIYCHVQHLVPIPTGGPYRADDPSCRPSLTGTPRSGSREGIERGGSGFAAG